MATNPLVDLSDALAQIVEQLSPSLVALERTHAPATGTAIAKDLVVTVAHVMGRSTEGSVRLPDGSEAKATLVGIDRPTDLAVVRIEGGALTVPDVDESGALKVAQLVLSLGRPGKNVRASLAALAGLGERWRTARGGDIDRFIDVDGALPFGFSGGPLVDARGRVVGLNTHGLLRGGATVPWSTVKRVASALEKHGTSKNGFLGAAVQPAKLPAALAAKLGRDGGLLVVSFADDGPAAKAGVRQGDILVALDGKPLAALDDLLAALAGRAHEAVKLDVIRGDAEISLTAALGERPEPRMRWGGRGC